MIRDHDATIEGVFDFVRGDRTLTVGYVKELHSLLTRHQRTCEAVVDFAPISGELFLINYREKTDDARERLLRWLDVNLVIALEMWRTGL